MDRSVQLRPRIIAIGASTGGTEAVKNIVEQLSANCPPVVIVVHMPAGFTQSFAKRMQALSKVNVCEAEHGQMLEAGRVYVAPGDLHLSVRCLGLQPALLLTEGNKVSGHRPSVDVMFHSIAENFKANAIGVILTGMGKDGAEGLLAMKQQGAHTIAQDEASSVVYGMPKEAVALNAHCLQLPLGQIADKINQAVTN